jgi:hypothetical protein
MRKEDTFQGIKNLVDLSVKLVKINRHNVYDLVYLLLKLVLVLPVTMTCVERAFSTMNFLKNNILRNMMSDGLLDDYFITFIDQVVFLNMKEEDIINYFMPVKSCRFDKNK